MNRRFYPIEEIKKVIDAEGFVFNPKTCIRTLAYDSRKLTDIQHTLFFAIEGRRDGHAYISEVYKAGVRSFVISNPAFNTIDFPEANFLLVRDTLKALQDLAGYHRSHFNYPVIAITGSNGKTIVKEWLYHLLCEEKNIVRSPKSYNSQIGVPLSLWEMNEDHQLAIIEAGISRPGEMEALARIIQPTIGILTNIGEAHNEGFRNKEEKISEKLKLFAGVDQFIFSPHYLQPFSVTLPGKNKFTWGADNPADLRIISTSLAGGRGLRLKAEFDSNPVEAFLPFTDTASIENGTCCWATMLALGYSNDVIAKRLATLSPVKMRLELKTGINNCSVIDDSYSSDVSSLSIALDFLRQQNQHPKRTLILSDILETGMGAQQLYEQVAHLLASKEVDRLIGVGPVVSEHQEFFKIEKAFFPDTDSLLEHFNELKFNHETILLKGARSFHFERISKLLTQKVHETILEINLKAIEHNLNYYKSRLKPDVRIMVMVKAFSYGSGSFEIANLLQFNKVDYLAVAYADEGVALRRAGISLPIMVMNPDMLAFDSIIEHELEPEIYDLRVLKDFTDTLDMYNRENYPVHLKIDTGMHRLGFMEEDIDDLLEQLRGNESIEVRSVFSHLVGSDDEDLDEFTKQQIAMFTRTTTRIGNVLSYPFLRHVANTAGIIRWPEAQFDMVRLGIGLYGVDTSGAATSPLQTVATLKTSISQIKHLKPGETVGYSRKGVLPLGGTIATVKLGYADGYNRKLGNGKGKMIVNGHPVPTIGNICMDMCMINITGLDVTEGDDVVVFGEDIRVEEVARQLDTIPYEILTGISQRVKRIYYYE